MTESRQRLNVRRVKKYYGRLCALNEVDLSVGAGEFVALLGPNGAGKSTLFQLLSGLFVADDGEIVIDGENLASSAIDALAKLGIVFQQLTLDLDLSVYRNLKFHCDLHGIHNARGIIQDSLRREGLIENLQSPCRSLSGGNRRKVELVRSLLHKPSILLMDEATVGLDPASRQKLVQNVKSLCKEQDLAVLWATHLVDEAVDADSVYILHRGRVLQAGTPDEIVHRSRQSDLLSAFLSLTEQSRAAENE